jgi:hypothetical protein
VVGGVRGGGRRGGGGGRRGGGAARRGSVAARRRVFLQPQRSAELSSRASSTTPANG